MAYNSTINTAAKYFAAISGIIEGVYWQNPTGKVEPSVLDAYIRDRNITLTQKGLKAHLWAKEQLSHAIDQWYKGGPHVIAIAQQKVLAFYKNVNIDEYLRHSNYTALSASLNRWIERERHYTMEGDSNSRIFCAHKAELTALAMERGVTVKELEEDSHLKAKLTEDLGGYHPSFLDPALEQWVEEF